MPYIPQFICSLLVLALCVPAGHALAASSYTGYDAGPPINLAPTPQNPVQLPPQLPAYLPNGAVNLDEAWIQNGGARLYWNTLLIPRQLKMSGATWIDPALTPQLIQPQAAPARKRSYTRRKAETKPTATVKAPEGAGATSLKLMPPASAAIPLPLTAAGVAAPASPQAPTEPAKSAPSLPTSPTEPKAGAVQSQAAPATATPLK